MFNSLEIAWIPGSIKAYITVVAITIPIEAKHNKVLGSLQDNNIFSSKPQCSRSRISCPYCSCS